MTTESEHEHQHAIDNANGWAATLQEEVAALSPVECEKCERWHAEDAECSTEYAGDTEDEARETAQERIKEGPLSVEVRSGWYTPGSEDREPEDFCILLSTGGPALRILGELDEHGQPVRAWLEWQDWGTPWTHHYIEGITDTLLEWCQQFYFGD